MNELDEQDLIDEILAQGPQQQRMIVVKVIGGGNQIHAEDNDGQMMIIDVEEMTVKSFLHGDKDLVHGELPNGRATWEVIGFYLGMTDGHAMDRVRYESTN
jgi:hypothetical protein